MEVWTILNFIGQLVSITLPTDSIFRTHMMNHIIESSTTLEAHSVWKSSITGSNFTLPCCARFLCKGSYLIQLKIQTCPSCPTLHSEVVLFFCILNGSYWANMGLVLFPIPPSDLCAGFTGTVLISHAAIILHQKTFKHFKQISLNSNAL